MDLTVDLSRLHPAVAQGIIGHLQHEDRARHALGLVEQYRLKRLYDEMAVPGMNTRLGRTTMVRSRDQWIRFMQKYGQLCWADPEFSPFVLKHHPDMRVKDVGERIQSGYTGKGDSRG
jgi:hypothetical protein